MSSRGLVILTISSVIGWYLAEGLLMKSVYGIVYGGPAEKAEASEFMKSILWILTLTGILISSVNSGTIFKVWKNDWSSNVFKGLAIGTIAFYLVNFPGFTSLSLLALYSACFGLGYGIGKLTGAILGRFIPKQFRVTS